METSQLNSVSHTQTFNPQLTCSKQETPMMGGQFKTKNKPQSLRTKLIEMDPTDVCRAKNPIMIEAWITIKRMTDAKAS